MTMAKKSRNIQYWSDRWLRLALLQERRLKPDVERTRKAYDGVQETFNKQLSEWYEKYADNDGLTYEEAIRDLNKVEQKTWSMELSEFRQKAIDGGYDQELNREYYRSRVTRLQMLKTQTAMELAEVAKESGDALHDLLSNEFTENYMRSIYEVHSQTGKILDGRIAADFGTYNQTEIDVILNTDWKGSNFSKRVWKNNIEELPAQLEKALSNGLMNGHSYDEMAKDLNKRFDVARNRAVSLVQTEAKHVRTQASLLAMLEGGAKRYLFLATLEVNTCEDCGSLDGKDFAIEDAKPGDNVPVIHPNCRCTIAPYVEEALRSNTRWMRDPVTGKGRRVPRVTFVEWKKKYAEAA